MASSISERLLNAWAQKNYIVIDYQILLPVIELQDFVKRILRQSGLPQTTCQNQVKQVLSKALVWKA